MFWKFRTVFRHMERSWVLTIKYHPLRGTIVTVNFDSGFKVPEMVKNRLCVVISPPIENRHGVCTIVPLSQSAPNPEMGYHYELTIPFQLPRRWTGQTRWVKADMICAVGFHRINLLSLGKDREGTRIYQTNTLSTIHMNNISQCVRESLAMWKKCYRTVTRLRLTWVWRHTIYHSRRHCFGIRIKTLPRATDRKTKASFWSVLWGPVSAGPLLFDLAIFANTGCLRLIGRSTKVRSITVNTHLEMVLILLRNLSRFQ